MLFRGWAAAVAAGGLLSLAMGAPAIAGGGVRIDTEPTSPQQALQLCTLGAECSTPMHLGFNLYRGDGSSFDTVYVYREGVVGLGAQLPTGASPAGGLGTLGNSFVAPGFDSYAGMDIQVLFAQMGGTIRGLASNDIANEVDILWLVHDPNQKVPDENDNLVDYRGVFQVQLITDAFDFSTDPAGPSGLKTVKASFGYSDPIGALNDEDASALFGLSDSFPEDGVFATGKFGYRYEGQGATFAFPAVTRDVDFVLGPHGVPEPQSWALMIVGLGLAGGGLRRRRTAAARA